MKVTFSIADGPEEWAGRQIERLGVAVTRAVRAAGRGLQQELRAQVKSAGLGARLANAIRRRDYPSGEATSMNAAAVVFASRGKRGAGGASAILDGFERGAVITTKRGRFLAVPTPEALRVRGRAAANQRVTPATFTQRTGLPLRYVNRSGRIPLLVVDQARISKGRGQIKAKGGRRRKRDGILTGEQTIVAFYLVRQVKLPKKLDLASPARRWLANTPRLVQNALEAADA